MTAYSTAVGPSSETTNRFTLCKRLIAEPFYRDVLNPPDVMCVAREPCLTLQT
jgi:hypothetical protein